MSDTIGTMFGFLGGTIVSVETGYRVLQHPNPHRVYQRLSEAKWFLALRWCEQFSHPAGILNHEGELSFYNEASLRIGSERFLPIPYRKPIFEHCLSLEVGEISTYAIPSCNGSSAAIFEVFSLDVDPRFGRVVVVQRL
ncbi:hypothetical protein [Oscillatoria sp. FACHB-1406]|uniref:hypothetical protein n=1 Tax=Oscillatoria sp. FACHB-1406 TaxID=2692846 RepID=UPI00168805B7|nr:hypothetical protein [Oscillatoria sp. FACHB-1406]MBD2577428.1 hypothetical protein [Oscillatoria sp. FACHB-1406]